MHRSSNDDLIIDATNVEDELEWEEWDGQSPFWTHCVAGGFAGVAEHTLLYPVDTVKTHMQSYCADCPHNPAVANSTGPQTATKTVTDQVFSHQVQSSSSSSIFKNATRTAAVGVGNNAQVAAAAVESSASADVGMWKTMNRLLYTSSTAPATEMAKHCAKEMPVTARANLSRLWTGVQTMMVGCAPAHALYFSSYEIVKHFSEGKTEPGTTYHHLGNMAAGAAATSMHDCIMTPLDTMKQRLQLGYYKGSMSTAFVEMVRHEGFAGLYRSFGITLLTNIPYGMIMVSTNEYLKHYLTQESQMPATTSTFLLAGCGAGAVASALTTPLDRIKTRLQTQTMGAAMTAMEVHAASSASFVATGTTTKCEMKPFSVNCYKHKAVVASVRYHGWVEAGQSIVNTEGVRGLFRGLTPRVLTHMPAVAISWTSYETVKRWLVGMSSP